MAGKKRRKLAASIVRLAVYPVIILGIVLTIHSQNSVREGMRYEIEKSLSGTAHNIISLYNMIDGGEFSYRDGHLYKGETDVTHDYRILDDAKSDTGAELTISYGKYRRLTTMVNSEGERIVGTELQENVIEQVLQKGKEYFSEDIDIGGEKYYGYYVPIRNDANEVVGVSFAGKSANSVNVSMHYVTEGNIIICIFVILLAGFICNFSARHIVEAIHYIKDFLGKLASGDFTKKMPEEVITRWDEFAEIGEYAVTVSQSLDEMISLDPLTKLLNRRACLIQAEERSAKEYVLVMCDIDHFKNVNDCYGHEMGDTVLKYVSKTLLEMVGDNGFASRWGGEEFLLGFDLEQPEVLEMLERTRKQIEKKEFNSDGKNFHITATFGLTKHTVNEIFDETVKRADHLLYQGKVNGRNQVVIND